MTNAIVADAWVAVELGDPTEVLERRPVEVPVPGWRRRQSTWWRR